MKEECDMSKGKSKKDITTGVISVLKKLMKMHGNAVFGGDGYSSEWHKEAVEKRGLKIKPMCSYTVAYIEKHPEYKRLLG